MSARTDGGADPGGAYREQDGVVVAKRHRGVTDSHAQYQWNSRVPDQQWEGYPVRTAWREAVPRPDHGAGEGAVARHHLPADMVLIAEYGILQTAYRAPESVATEQRQPTAFDSATSDS